MNIIQIYKQLPDHESCIKHLEFVRWNNVAKCPYCNSTNATPVPKELRYHCNNCNTSFSVTVGTIFHKTKLDLQKWFVAVSIILNAKKGVSSRQLSRDIDVTKDTAWFMQMRIRRALVEYGDLLKGIVEADETFIGGKNKNRQNDKKVEGSQGRSTKDKTPVMGVIERGGRIKARKVNDTTGKTIQKFVGQNVEQGSTVMTDEWQSYNVLDKKYVHYFINHSAGEYVKGAVHTNTLEGFWSLLKRGVVGQYHHVSEKYLNKYINEFCFRFNERENSEIFELTLKKAVGISN